MVGPSSQTQHSRGNGPAEKTAQLKKQMNMTGPLPKGLMSPTAGAVNNQNMPQGNAVKQKHSQYFNNDSQTNKGGENQEQGKKMTAITTQGGNTVININIESNGCHNVGVTSGSNDQLQSNVGGGVAQAQPVNHQSHHTTNTTNHTQNTQQTTENNIVQNLNQFFYPQSQAQKGQQQQPHTDMQQQFNEFMSLQQQMQAATSGATKPKVSLKVAKQAVAHQFGNALQNQQVLAAHPNLNTSQKLNQTIKKIIQNQQQINNQNQQLAQQPQIAVPVAPNEKQLTLNNFVKVSNGHSNDMQQFSSRKVSTKQPTAGMSQPANNSQNVKKAMLGATGYISHYQQNPNQEIKVSRGGIPQLSKQNMMFNQLQTANLKNLIKDANKEIVLMDNKNKKKKDHSTTSNSHMPVQQFASNQQQLMLSSQVQSAANQQQRNVTQKLSADTSLDANFAGFQQMQHLGVGKQQSSKQGHKGAKQQSQQPNNGSRKHSANASNHQPASKKASASQEAGVSGKSGPTGKTKSVSKQTGYHKATSQNNKFLKLQTQNVHNLLREAKKEIEILPPSYMLSNCGLEYANEQQSPKARKQELLQLRKYSLNNDQFAQQLTNNLSAYSSSNCPQPVASQYQQQQAIPQFYAHSGSKLSENQSVLLSNQAAGAASHIAKNTNMSPTSQQSLKVKSKFGQVAGAKKQAPKQKQARQGAALPAPNLLANDPSIDSIIAHQEQPGHGDFNGLGVPANGNCEHEGTKVVQNNQRDSIMEETHGLNLNHHAQKEHESYTVDDCSLEVKEQVIQQDYTQSHFDEVHDDSQCIDGQYQPDMGDSQINIIQNDQDQSSQEITDQQSKLQKSQKIQQLQVETEQSNLSLNQDQKVIQIEFPISTPKALKYFMEQLTDYEQSEILDYKKVYFLGLDAKKIKGSPLNQFNFGFDDDKGDYNVVLQDHIAYRFEVIDFLGKGSFGQALRCMDHKTGEIVAVKVIRNKKRFQHQAQVELKILQHLRDNDSEDTNNIIRIKDHCMFRKHLIISFELFSINLYEFIKNNNFQGVSLSLIRRFAIQILQALKYLKEENVIHCDLKPENILLKSPDKSGIKVIDFGSSCFQNERIYTYIQSRFYRAPEIVLGIPYTPGIDMWSFGCILIELYTGIPIFPGESEQEQISLIMEVLGLPPQEVLEQSTRKRVFFDENDDQPKLTSDSRGRLRIPGSKPLGSILRCNDELFLDFVSKCLDWNPDTRIQPLDALMHEWILEGLPPKVLMHHKRMLGIETTTSSDDNELKFEELPNYQKTQKINIPSTQNNNLLGNQQPNCSSTQNQEPLHKRVSSQQQQQPISLNEGKQGSHTNATKIKLPNKLALPQNMFESTGNQIYQNSSVAHHNQKQQLMSSTQVVSEILRQSKGYDKTTKNKANNVGIKKTLGSNKDNSFENSESAYMDLNQQEQIRGQAAKLNMTGNLLVSNNKNELSSHINNFMAASQKINMEGSDSQNEFAGTISNKNYASQVNQQKQQKAKRQNENSLSHERHLQPKKPLKLIDQKSNTTNMADILRDINKGSQNLNHHLNQWGASSSGNTKPLNRKQQLLMTGHNNFESGGVELNEQAQNQHMNMLMQAKDQHKAADQAASKHQHRNFAKVSGAMSSHGEGQGSAVYNQKSYANAKKQGNLFSNMYGKALGAAGGGIEYQQFYAAKQFSGQSDQDEDDDDFLLDGSFAPDNPIREEQLLRASQQKGLDQLHANQLSGTQHELNDQQLIDDIDNVFNNLQQEESKQNNSSDYQILNNEKQVEQQQFVEQLISKQSSSNTNKMGRQEKLENSQGQSEQAIGGPKNNSKKIPFSFLMLHYLKTNGGKNQEDAMYYDAKQFKLPKESKSTKNGGGGYQRQFQNFM